MENRVRFTYVRDKNRRPVGCVAFTLDRETNVVSWATSTHNPADTFDKKVGRKIATLRLANPNQFLFNKETYSNNIITALLEQIANNKNEPNRLRRQANRFRLWF